MKRINYLLFWFLNILLLPIIPLVLVFMIGIWLSLNDSSQNILEEKDIFVISFFVCLLLFFYLIRVCILPLIYVFSKKNNYINNFFEKIKKEKNYRNKVLVSAFVLDIITILLFLSETFLYGFKDFLLGFIFCYLFGGGGVFISYISLIIWIKFFKK